MNVLDSGDNGARVQLGIRPEDVEIAATAADGWQPARIVVVEPMGSETLVTVDYRDQRLVARVGANRWFESGQTVWVRLPGERTLTFDPVTGRLEGGREPF
jgi:multiple sugar transport system ATP-binding protein